MGFQLLGSFLSDYVKLKYILMVQIIGMILLSLGIIFLREGAPLIILIAGLGINQGLFGVNANIAWARFFGRKHLGVISGFAFAWLVAGSAAGPYLFSLSLDLSGKYVTAAIFSLAVLVVLLAGAWKANQPKVVKSR